MSWTTEAKQILGLASSGLTALEMIGDLIAPILGGDLATLDAKVVGALRTTEAIVTAIRNGTAGNVSTEQVTDSLTQLKSQLAANDQQSQTDIDLKFSGR